MATSSVNKKISRYVQGGDSFISSADRIKWWERTKLEEADDDFSFLISPRYEFRPDRIAFEMYGKASYAWIVLQFNTIVDINEELKSGKVIRLPQKSRVIFDMNNKTPGGIREEE